MENDALSFQDAVSSTMFALRLRQFLSTAEFTKVQMKSNLAMASIFARNFERQDFDRRVETSRRISSYSF